MDLDRCHYETHRAGLEFQAAVASGPMKDFLVQQIEWADQLERLRLSRLALQGVFLYLATPPVYEHRSTITLTQTFVIGAAATRLAVDSVMGTMQQQGLERARVNAALSSFSCRPAGL